MKKKVLISSGILAFLLIVGSSKKTDNENLFVEVKNGVFEINVSVSGELKAERSEDILGPTELRSQLLGYMQVKIQDLIPEGTVVDSGQYVATLDRTEASNKLKDIEDEIQKSESNFIKTQLDSTISLREQRNNILNMKYALEEKELILAQSKFEAPATIRQAQIELDKAKRTYEQTQENYKLKVQQYTASMSDVGINMAQVRRKKEAMEKLLQKFIIYAPKSGMVIFTKDWNGQKRKVGSIVSPWELQVATLPDMTSMLSKTFVNEIDISKIKVNQAVDIKLDAFPEKSFTGKITAIANVGEQLPNSDSKVFEVMIKINESDDVMRPAMTTSNIIKIATYPNKLSLPLEAIHNDDSLTYVFTKKGNKQLVLLGQMSDNEVIIEKGLKKGDKVWLTTPNDSKDWRLTGLELKAEILKKKKDISTERKAVETSTSSKKPAKNPA
jgi:multidrug resistance efflux pump